MSWSGVLTGGISTNDYHILKISQCVFHEVYYYYWLTLRYFFFYHLWAKTLLTLHTLKHSKSMDSWCILTSTYTHIATLQSRYRTFPSPLQEVPHACSRKNPLLLQEATTDRFSITMDWFQNFIRTFVCFCFCLFCPCILFQG